ncbi:hypothetical protein TRICI_002366 [Trichomonascus ciferrii]|uniref:Arginase n=1 Tax=Trichomonascus ciferrii TaxID=44093 RepID=A0A642V731_9ASCO|nr:hypothetical protein TRICI_002366 [Trichomonascus ciferrii]
MAFEGVSLIFCPYHVGIRDYGVGKGPHKLRSMGLEWELMDLGLDVEVREIGDVDEFEGEIGRSFKLIRRVSVAVTEIVAENRFPLILAGNCMTTAGVACGLKIRDLGFIYFDAHDDLNSPDVIESGYFDSMGLSCLRGESWKALMSTVPGFRPFNYDKFLYIGLRDQTEIQMKRVESAGMDQIRGDVNKKVDFLAELEERLDEKAYSPSLVHLDMDVLDEAYGKVNKYSCPGGMYESDLVDCMRLVATRTSPQALTVCSFDPEMGDSYKIATIAIRALTAFFEQLLSTNSIRLSKHE